MREAKVCAHFSKERLNLSTSTVILVLGATYFAAHFLAFVFEKTKLPDVLILMIVGMVAGPVLGIVTPDDFGRAGDVATTVALAVILFESGTTLSLSSIRSSVSRLVPLAVLTFILSVLIVAGLAMVCFGMPWALALATGAILGGTSSAVVIPLVKSLNLSDRAGTLLILESAITDVLCIVFALALLDGYQDGGLSASVLAVDVLLSLGVAAIIGLAGGFMWLFVLNDVRRFPSTTFTTVAFAFLLYGFAELVGASGAIATLAYGVAIANGPSAVKGRELAHLTPIEKGFFQEIVFLLKTFFFLYLGISMKISSYWPVIVALLVVAAIYFVRLWITKFTLGKLLEPIESVYTSLLIPKGLAAAVLAGIPLQRQLPYGETIQIFAYAVVLLSIFTTAVLVPIAGRGRVGRLLNSFFPGPKLPPPVTVEAEAPPVATEP